MPYVLGLEAIGDDSLIGLRRPWVAEILGPDPRWGAERRFLRGKKSYRRSNSIGSRGVYVYYTLREGPLYEVNELVSWSRSRRYRCRVVGGELVEVQDA